MSDIFEELAAEAAEVTAVPDDVSMATLREKCEELVRAETEVDDLEEKLKTAKEKKNALAHKELPEIFGKLGVDHFGLAEAGVDLEMKPYYKASIPEDSDEEFKQAAFAHLEELGGGDIIKTMVTYTLGKTQIDLARTITAMIRMLAEQMQIEGVSDIPVPAIKMGVQWNTLTAFVREQYERQQTMVLDEDGKPTGPIMNLEKLNATVGQVVKIKKRK